MPYFDQIRQRVTHFRFASLVGPCVLLLAALVAVAPELIHGPSCGHDFDFHLASWIDVLNSWKHGVLYPHWNAAANFTAGEPRFVFYPPLTWMLGAALGALLPWNLVPVALTFTILALTGLATRLLAREYLINAPATLAGCFAIFSGYTLFTAYERTAFGELAGGFWIPLLLFFALRRRTHENDLAEKALIHQTLDGSACLLALTIVGAWLSNAPLGVMASYLLALVALLAALVRRSLAPLLRAALAVTLGIGLSAFFLVPAAFEQRWINVSQATEDPGERIENSFLFGHHADASLALHDQELLRVSLLGSSMIAVAFLGLLFASRQRRIRGGWRNWLPVALLPLVILLLQLPFSLPLWNLLPKLRFLQFPWRFYVALGAPLGIFVAAAIWPKRRALRYGVTAGVALVLIGASLFTERNFLQACDAVDSVPGMLSAYHAGNGFVGTDEYAPPAVDNAQMAMNLPGACLLKDATFPLGAVPPDEVFAELEMPAPVWKPEQHSCLSNYALTHDRPESYRLQAMIDQPGNLVLRLRSYPAWVIRVNGKVVTDLKPREDGLIAIPVAAGPVDLTVRWQITRDAFLGRLISAVFFVLFALVVVIERQLTRQQVS